MEAKELINKERYDLSDLRTVFACLRGENGCPWDKVQTHETIRGDLIEETYEVVEAIDKADMKLMREELGDLLLQVVFHAVIEEEKGTFTLDDVISDLTDKLIRRHPHVFADVKADDPDSAIDSWEAAKGVEKAERRTVKDKLNAIPPSLPALMRAEKICGKASKEGYDTESVITNGADSVMNLAFLMKANYGKKEDTASQIGEALFAVSAYAKALKIDAEHELNKMSDSFIENYQEP